MTRRMGMLSEQEIEAAYLKWMTDPNPEGGGSLRDAFYAACRIGRNAGLEEAVAVIRVPVEASDYIDGIEIMNDIVALKTPVEDWERE